MTKAVLMVPTSFLAIFGSYIGFKTGWRFFHCRIKKSSTGVEYLNHQPKKKVLYSFSKNSKKNISEGKRLQLSVLMTLDS